MHRSIASNRFAPQGKVQHPKSEIGDGSCGRRAALRFASGHPECVTGWEAVQHGPGERREANLPKHASECGGREVIAVRRDMDAAPVLAHEAAIPARVVRRFQDQNAAGFQCAKGDAQTLNRLPLVLEVPELRDDIEGIFGNRGLGYGTDKDGSAGGARLRGSGSARAQVHAHHVKLLRRPGEKAAVATAQVKQLAFPPPAHGVRQLAVGSVAAERAREAREKHEDRATGFPARGFLGEVVDPVVLGGLRVVGQRLIADEHHFTAGALDDFPALPLKQARAIEGAAERAGALMVIRGFGQATVPGPSDLGKASRFYHRRHARAGREPLDKPRRMARRATSECGYKRIEGFSPLAGWGRLLEAGQWIKASSQSLGPEC